MKNLLLGTILLFLAGCTTTETYLKNNQTGATVKCGGRFAYIGAMYPFMESNDQKCVTDYESKGFKRLQ